MAPTKPKMIFHERKPAETPLQKWTASPFRVRCNLFKRITKNAIWLKRETVSDLDLLKNTLDDFQAHLNCGCFCTSRSATYLAMSATHLELFCLMFKNSMQFLNDQESLAKTNADEANKKKKSNLNDIEMKEESSFINATNENVTQSNFIKLINNVINALKTYEKAFQLDEKEKVFTWTFLSRLNTLNNLNTIFEIFIYYGLNIYAIQVADLVLKVIDSYHPEGNDNNDEIMVAKHNIVKLYLKLGFVDTAKLFYKRYLGHVNVENVAEIESYGHSLAFLLHCELCLRSRNGKAVAAKLKQFIDGEYLKKNTIKRFILKALASHLASRFPSAVYPFETLPNEFLDPVQISVGICRRWKLFNTYFSGTDMHHDDFLDPWWQRFATFSLFSVSLEDFLEFHLNNGLTNDLFFYYKIAHNLFTLTLNLQGLAKLQLIGAKYDIHNGFVSDAECKLASFKRHFQNTMCNEALFNGSPLESGSQSECNLDDSLVLRTNRQLLIGDAEEESDDEDISPAEKMLQCYKRLMIRGSRSKCDDADHESEYKLELSSLENVLQMFVRDFGGIKMPTDMILNLFQLYLYYLINQILLDYHRNDSKNPDSLSPAKYLLVLKLLESFTMGVYYVTFRELDSQSIKRKNAIKTSMNEQLMNGPIGTVFWFLNDSFVRIMIEHGFHRQTLCYLNKLVDISSYSYQDRIQRSKMFYYRALVLYKLLKKANAFTESQKIFHMKTNLLTENLKINQSEKIATPTGHRNKTIRKIPVSKMMAPKKNEGMSSTVKLYGQSLLQKASEAREALEGTRKNVLDFNEPELVDADDQESQESTLVMRQGPKSTLKARIPSNSRFGIFEDDDDGYSSMLSISHFITNSNMTAINEEFLVTLFDPEEFEKTFDIRSVSMDDVKLALKKMFSYVGCQMSFPLYLQVHDLFFKMAKATSKSGQSLAYHFAESAPCHAFRQRLLFNVLKKMAATKSVSVDTWFISFKPDDYNCQSYINEFPKTWRFVQIKSVMNGTKFPDLLLCRFQSGCRPIFLKIKTDFEKVTKHFMEEFEEIMKMNNVSIFETEKTVFWKLRFEYDNRLKVLLNSVENTVLGLVKGLFLGQLNDKKYVTMCRWFKKKVVEVAQEMNIACKDTAILDVITESMALLKTEEAEVAAKMIFNTDQPKFVAKFMECRKKAFTTWSKKDKLQQLYEDVHPVGLIIDPELIQFPFESLPSFRQLNQPFFRVPSLRVASFLYRRHKNSVETGVEDDETFYLLNPGNNLGDTENLFKRQMQSIHQWTGTVGRAPEGISLLKDFETKQVYIYMGHGSGSQYYRQIPNGLDVVDMKTAAVVVGCSSGRITRETKHADMFGSAYRFLINGAPCYIGNLWDITDKDIDIFFNRFMTHWFKRWNPEDQKHVAKVESICRSLSLSRDSCKLKYLIGCAPVIYGLPIINDHHPK